MELESVKLLAAAIALIPLFGVALALGQIFSSYNEAIGRNPKADEILGGKYMLFFALTEALAIFALVVSLLILFK
jgi:F0F1-type ATP synthase membrane subunit c/vacuolar-type H+-ATPase subunit K